VKCQYQLILLPCQLEVVHLLIVDHLHRESTLHFSYSLTGTDVGGVVARINSTYLYETSFLLSKVGSYILEVQQDGKQVPRRVFVLLATFYKKCKLEKGTGSPGDKSKYIIYYGFWPEIW
jgi:hypothetical protein